MAQARIRTIKPDFWESERLGNRSPLARLTFIGLISLADDQGRGRAHEGFLFGRLHPYGEKVTIKEFRESLAELFSLTKGESLANKKPLVVRYEPAGEAFYFLPTWFDNQKIDRPSDSVFPEPPAAIAASMEIAEALKEPRPAPSKPFAKIADIWNRLAPKELARVKEISKGRERHFKARWLEHPDSAYWEGVVGEIAKSPFLMGKVKPWRASIDWLLRPDSAAKVLEGAYTDPGYQPPAPPKGPPKPWKCGRCPETRIAERDLSAWDGELCKKCSEEDSAPLQGGKKKAKVGGTGS